MEWRTEKLGDVCELIKRGVAPKYVDEGGICVINQKCIRNHSINLKPSRRHDPIAKTVNPERYIGIGDVLVNSTGTGTLGRVAQVRSKPDEPTTVDTHVTIVRPSPKMFYPDFFGYMLIKIEGEIASSGEGTSGQTELARSTLENKFYVSFPTSLPEQKRIVAILDETFEGIGAAVANAKKNLANARELFESYLNNVFTQKGEGWVERKLGDIVEISHGYAFKGPDFGKSDEENKAIVLTPGNYTADGKLSFTMKNTKRFTGTPPNGYLFAVGDLTVVMTDLSSKMKILGKPAFIDRPNILHNQRIGRILFKNDLLSRRYVFYFLRTKVVGERIKETSTGTMVRHTAPKRILANTVAFPPTVEEQEDIVDRLNSLAEETKRLETVYRQKLTTLAELKQSILQKAFSGELTRQEAAA